MCDNYATVSVSHPTWRALRDVQVVSIPSCSSTTSSTKRTTPQCGPCSDAIVGRATTACVSSPRDWAVSTSKHMQQNMGILFHASVSGRALFLFLNPFPQRGCYNACVTPRWAPSSSKSDLQILSIGTRESGSVPVKRIMLTERHVCKSSTEQAFSRIHSIASEGRPDPAHVPVLKFISNN